MPYADDSSRAALLQRIQPLHERDPYSAPSRPTLSFEAAIQSGGSGRRTIEGMLVGMHIAIDDLSMG
jgi:hypothetical protein